ncbi:MAG: hypothetical protein Q8L27_02680 [archaeon]|nr:hypothetical protein [archaeon]
MAKNLLERLKSRVSNMCGSYFNLRYSKKIEWTDGWTDEETNKFIEQLEAYRPTYEKIVGISGRVSGV